jgi:hypothetical protein
VVVVETALVDGVVVFAVERVVDCVTWQWMWRGSGGRAWRSVDERGGWGMCVAGVDENGWWWTSVAIGG